MSDQGLLLDAPYTGSSRLQPTKLLLLQQRSKLLQYYFNQTDRWALRFFWGVIFCIQRRVEPSVKIPVSTVLATSYSTDLMAFFFMPFERITQVVGHLMCLGPL